MIPTRNTRITKKNKGYLHTCVRQPLKPERPELNNNSKRLLHITVGLGPGKWTKSRNIEIPETNPIHYQSTITLTTVISQVMMTRVPPVCVWLLIRFSIMYSQLFGIRSFRNLHVRFNWKGSREHTLGTMAEVPKRVCLIQLQSGLVR